MAKKLKTTRRSRNDSARAFAAVAARTARDNNAEEIVVLDLRGVSPVTDYFVICTGTSGRQMATVAQEIIEAGKSLGQTAFRVAGLESPTWIVLDFVDVVVHIFDNEHRRYYDLELIWGEASRLQWQRVRVPAAMKDQRTIGSRE